MPALTRCSPSADDLAAADPEVIGKLGIVRQRVRALQALAAEVVAGRIALHRGAPLAATLDALRALPGIGEWTAQLIAMRALAWPDAWPASDIGLMNALGHARRQACGATGRGLAALARLCRDAAVAPPGDLDMKTPRLGRAGAHSTPRSAR